MNRWNAVYDNNGLGWVFRPGSKTGIPYAGSPHALAIAFEDGATLDGYMLTDLPEEVIGA